MIRLNIHEAKTHLSQHLEAVERGEVILLCRRNVPIAEIRRVERAPKGPRPLGAAHALYPDFEVPDSFFEPLSDEELRLWEGGE